jgi:hypothetical protein
MDNENPTRADYSRTQADYLAYSRCGEADRACLLLEEIQELSLEQQLHRLYMCVLDVARGNSVATEIRRRLTGKVGKVPYKGVFNPFPSLPPELEAAFHLEDYIFDSTSKQI